MKKSLFILIILAIGIFIPIYVLWKNIFPSFEYQLKNADAYGISVAKEDFGNRQYFTVPVLGQYSFDNIKFSIYLSQINNNDIQIKVAKGYKINTYPEGESIKNVQTLKNLIFSDGPDIPNGFIFSYDNSAYVASRGKYYPILSAEVFELMGYQWDNVRSVNSDIFNKLEKTDKINYMSPHPDGTIVKEKNGSYYLIWEKQKRKIEDSNMIMDVWNEFYWVDLASIEPDYFSECNVRWMADRMVCDFQLNETVNIYGKTYIFQINPPIDGDVEEAKVRFSAKANFDRDYLRYVFGELKNKLFLRYGQYF